LTELKIFCLSMIVVGPVSVLVGLLDAFMGGGRTEQQLLSGVTSCVAMFFVSRWLRRRAWLYFDPPN
jgi:hypothetical protein